MAVGDAGVVTRAGGRAEDGLKSFLGKYFYLCMSLVMTAIIVAGFSRTVNPNLFHATPARPLLLWFHGAAFSTWMVLLIVQSSLVRVRKVAIHRTLGWFGAALAATMVVLGFTIAVVMARFDTYVLKQPGADAFMAIPFEDMFMFGGCMALAIAWRKRTDYHRRLVFLATCQLMDAGLGRFDFIFNHSLFYPGLDLLIVAGMVRDIIVEGRVHKVYRYALLIIIASQVITVYAWRANPAWWQAITRVFMGA